MIKNYRNLFVAFEGIDGAGKSTQVDCLYRSLIKQNISVIKTSEPDGTAFGINMKNMIFHYYNDMASIHPSSYCLNAETETLMFAAIRSYHVTNIIRPALKNNKIVITDRYIDSSLAYQAYARKLNVSVVNMINNWATKDLIPDLTILLDINPVKIQQKRKLKLSKEDIFEKQTIDFYIKVRNAFLKIANQNKKRYLILKAEHKMDSIAKQIFSTVIEMINLKPQF